ncbi:CAP domain-containing protein [Natronospora cellulosivora (SeqCode)]
MRSFKSKKIALFLAVIIFFNIFSIAIFSQQAQASFWEDNRGSILTVFKGFIMLWVINLMTGSSGGDDYITSTIQRALNLGGRSNEENLHEEEIEDNSSSLEFDEIGYDSSYDSDGQNIIYNENVTSEEFEMLRLVNEARQEQGLRPLQIDIPLMQLARKKAVDMIEYDYFDHYSPNLGTPFEMIQANDIKYSLAGENLAEAKTIKEAFDSLMDSPDHRENILTSRYDRVGIGIIQGSSSRFMIVQLFIDSPDPTE